MDSKPSECTFMLFFVFAMFVGNFRDSENRTTRKN